MAEIDYKKKLEELDERLGVVADKMDKVTNKMDKVANRFHNYFGKREKIDED